MFRAASRLPKRTLLAATAAGTVALQERPREKLSIYPSPDPEIILIKAPSALETHIGIARRQVCQTYRDGRDYVQGWVSKWIGIEHAVENRVKSIISPQESLTPGLLYVGVATLTGSIIARNRRLLTRFVLPPAFLFVSAIYFLPKTTTNLSGYFGSIEDTYFPAFSEKHEIAKAHTVMTWEKVKEATKGTRLQVNRGAVSAVEKVQEVTGLKLRETFGWAGETKEKVETKAIQVTEAIEKVVEEKKAVVEQKLEEVTESGKKVGQEEKKDGQGEKEDKHGEKRDGQGENRDEQKDERLI